LIEFDRMAKHHSEAGRPPLWTGMVKDGKLYGQNPMGKMMMEVRDQLAGEVLVPWGNAEARPRGKDTPVQGREWPSEGGIPFPGEEIRLRYSPELRAIWSGGSQDTRTRVRVTRVLPRGSGGATAAVVAVRV
jgi:hypothetical protein